MLISALFLAIFGLSLVIGAGLFWPWMRNLRRAKLLIEAIGGPERARRLYFGLGWLLLMLARWRFLN